MEATSFKNETLLKDLCRTCAKSNTSLVPLFEKGSNSELLIKLTKYLPVKLSENDGMPNNICIQCVSTLEEWHKMFIKCIEADKKFNSLNLNINKCNEEFKKVIYNTDEYSSSENEEIDINTLWDIFLKHKNKKTNDMHTNQSLKFCINGDCSINNQGNTLKKSTENQLNTQRLNNEAQSLKSGNNTFNAETDIKEIIKELCVNSNQSQDYLMDGFNELNKIMIEKQNKKRIKSFICSICEKSFGNDKTLSAHLIHHSSNSKFTCNKCKATFKNKTNLNKHMQSVHLVKKRNNKQSIKETNAINKIGIINGICGLIINSKNELFHNIVEKKDQKYYNCSICDEKFSARISYYRHKLKHEDNSCICDICGKVFDDSYLLKLHSNIHCFEMLYKCDVCGKSFKMKENLMLHNAVHFDSHLYSCPYCIKTFKRHHHL